MAWPQQAHKRQSNSDTSMDKTDLAGDSAGSSCMAPTISARVLLRLERLQAAVT